MRQLFTLLLVGASLTAFSQNGVGIGTTSPHTSALLELKSSTKGLILPRTSSASRNAMTGTKGLIVYDTTLSRIYYHTGTSWAQVTTGTIPTAYWTANGNHIYNNNSSNVGIGISSPTSKLTVANNIEIEGSIPAFVMSSTGSTARINFILDSQEPDFAITQFNNKFYLSRFEGLGFVDDLVISELGYIGVGTAVVDVRLTVDEGSDVGPASGGYIQTGLATGLNIGIDNNEIQARNNGASSRLVLQNDAGPLQIGNVVAPTGYKVAVNGKVICEELKIQDAVDWPDYVFADDYKLASLDEVRNFIELHHHLPNIPSAAEVESNGIVVGDMQKRLMEKIEELTLYILDLEALSKSMQSEIASLKAARQ